MTTRGHRLADLALSASREGVSREEWVAMCARIYDLANLLNTRDNSAKGRAIAATLSQWLDPEAKEPTPKG